MLEKLGQWEVIEVWWSKFERIVQEMKNIVMQIQNWTELVSCRCSQNALKETMYYANKWEIWEKFRGVLSWNQCAIESLAKYIVNQQL